MTPTVTRFAALLRGRENCYGVYYYPPQDGKKAHTAKGVTPESAWINHLGGTGNRLGQAPILQDNTCVFGAIDVDDDGMEHQPLAAAVDALGLPLVTCRSKSGGAHLYVFMREPVSAELMVKKLKQFMKALNLDKNHDGRPIEVFPKQTRIRAQMDAGWINLPYFNAEATETYAVDASGKHLTLDEFLAHAESRQLSAADFTKLSPKGGNPFDEGPPCLQVLHGLGYPAGTRNNGMYNIGVFMKLAHPDSWQEQMVAYNQEKMDPPMSVGELQGILSSVDKRDYKYKCNESPIQPHCQKAACKQQRFGIGGFEKAKVQALFPELAALTKIETDPPRWTVSVNGKIVEVPTEDLMLLTRFRKAALEKAMIVIPMIKQNEWDDILRGLMAEVVIVHAPEDAGVVGQFTAYVRQFLDTRRFAETKDDILAGRPFTENGRIYFRATDLSKFLNKQGFRHYEPAQQFTALREHLKAEHENIYVKGTKTRVWSVPAPTDDVKRLDTAKVAGKAY